MSQYPLLFVNSIVSEYDQEIPQSQTTDRYLDDILNINNVYFDNMVSQIYPSELHLNKANTSDTNVAFLDLHLSISNDIVSTKKFIINVTTLIMKLSISHFRWR